MRLSRQAEAPASLKSRWTELNLPQVSTLAVIEGSAGSFTTFFLQHDATFAPITNGERRGDSDGTASSPNPTRSQSPSFRHARIESQPRPQPLRLRQSPFRYARHPPTLPSVELAASTYWHDLSLRPDARRDVARCCWRRPPHRQRTWAPHAPAHPSPCSLRPACKTPPWPPTKM